MVSVEEAYAKVEKLPGRNFLISCGEYENEWSFTFKDELIEYDIFTEPVGTLIGYFDVVNKKTGEHEDKSRTILQFVKQNNKKRRIDITQFPKGRHTKKPETLGPGWTPLP